MIRKFSQLPLLLLVVTFSIYGCVSQFKKIKSKEELAQHNPKRVVWEKDNSEMVLVPSGNFDMGDHLDEMSNVNDDGTQADHKCPIKIMFKKKAFVKERMVDLLKEKDMVTKSLK